MSSRLAAPQETSGAEAGNSAAQGLTQQDAQDIGTVSNLREYPRQPLGRHMRRGAGVPNSPTSAAGWRPPWVWSQLAPHLPAAAGAAQDRGSGGSRPGHQAVGRMHPGPSRAREASTTPTRVQPAWRPPRDHIGDESHAPTSWKATRSSATPFSAAWPGADGRSRCRRPARLSLRVQPRPLHRRRIPRSPGARGDARDGDRERMRGVHPRIPCQQKAPRPSASQKPTFNPGATRPFPRWRR